MSYNHSRDNNESNVIDNLTNGGCNCPVYTCPAKTTTCCNGIKRICFNPNKCQAILTYADTVFDIKDGESTPVSLNFCIPLYGSESENYDTVIRYFPCNPHCAQHCFEPSEDAQFNVCSASARIISIEPARPLRERNIEVNCDRLFGNQSLEKESANFYKLFLGSFDPTVDNEACPNTLGRNASISIRLRKLKYIIQYTVCGTVTDGGQTYKFFIQTRNKVPMTTDSSVFNYIKQICIPKQASIFPPYVNLLFNYEIELVDCVKIKRRRCIKNTLDSMDKENLKFDEFNGNIDEFEMRNHLDDTDQVDKMDFDFDNEHDFGQECNIDDNFGCVPPSGAFGREFAIFGIVIIKPNLHAEAVRPVKVVTIANVITDPNFPTTIPSTENNAGLNR